MKFTHTYTTRWHDTDANRVLRTSKILMYLQETGNIQCAEFGVPLDNLRDERGVGFILSTLSLKVYRPIRAFEKIEVSTWCLESHGFSFSRFFEIRIGGEIIAEASSVWGLVDINTKTLVKADESLAPHFPYDEPIGKSNLPPRAKIGKTAQLCKVGDRTIHYSDIDYNMHMNNTNYPDMICDFSCDMDKKFISEISLSYLKESPLGATLEIYRGEPRQDGYTEFRTVNSNGDICLEAIVKYSDI